MSASRDRAMSASRGSIMSRRPALRLSALTLALGLASALGALFATEARADYFPKLYTGTRANGMGGAFVAIADDEQAIFLNPAGLAGVKGLTFNYAAADVEVSWDAILTGLSGMTSLGEINGDTLNLFQGKNIFGNAQFAPSLVMPGFGVGLISNGQFALYETNVANPNMKMTYMITNGFQVGFGGSVFPKRMRMKQDLRVGIAGKMMWRRGGVYDLGVLDLLNLTQDPIGSLHSITGNFGRGFGVDLGAQYLRHVGKRLVLSTGLSIQDLGDTAFADDKAMPQKSNVTWGLGATYNLKRIKFTYALDYAHLLQDMDFRSRLHTGFELQMPFVTLSAGLYQLNLAYGASFDLWIFRVTASSYATELGTFGGQNSERRYAARIALKVGF